MTQEEIQSALLKLLQPAPFKLVDLVDPQRNARLRAKVTSEVNVTFEADWFEVCEAVWALIARRLAWISAYEPSPHAWRVALTERGKAAAENDGVNPDDAFGYMRRLLRDAAGTSDVVQLYLRESLKSLEQECYLASAVMLGVAAEACMLEAADAFVTWSGPQASKLKAMLENPRTFYVVKLEEFQKRLAAARGLLPPELSDNLDLDVTAVIQLIRLTRNDAGHPTERQIDRQDAFDHLVIYARANKRLYELMEFFERTQSRATAAP